MLAYYNKMEDFAYFMQVTQRLKLERHAYSNVFILKQFNYSRNKRGRMLTIDSNYLSRPYVITELDNNALY